MGNTFPAVVFFTFGGFWGTFGATLTPFFNAVNGYGTDAAGFYDSFAMFLIFMAVLCLFYTIAALRTNVCLVIILTCFTITFPCLAASYFYAADGVAASAACRIAGAAFAFIASMVAWYLVSQSLPLSIEEATDNSVVVLHDPRGCRLPTHLARW